jgi:hypothetical protein
MGHDHPSVYTFHTYLHMCRQNAGERKGARGMDFDNKLVGLFLNVQDDEGST